MKTQQSTKSETNSINIIINTKNQKVMKTKKYSNVMKAFMAVAMMFLIAGVAFSQTSEERKGSSATYSVAAGDPTDEYTWTIAAPDAPASVTPAPTSGSGTIADPYVIDWTVDLTSIQVQWAADASPDINSISGAVSVQKRINAGAICPSPVQTMNIAFWSNPTAVVDPSETDLFVCSGDPIGGSITINLTGAPDGGQSGNDGFEVIYDVAVSDAGLTVSGANGPVGTDQSVTSDDATVTIPLPDALLNTTSGPQTYTITLSTVQDDFDETPVVIAGQVYTITVYPAPTTGDITSTGSLTRR